MRERSKTHQSQLFPSRNLVDVGLVSPISYQFVCWVVFFLFPLREKQRWVLENEAVCCRTRVGAGCLPAAGWPRFRLCYPQVSNQYLLCLREGVSNARCGRSGLHLCTDWTENIQSKSWVVGYKGREVWRYLIRRFMSSWGGWRWSCRLINPGACSTGASPCQTSARNGLDSTRLWKFNDKS